MILILSLILFPLAVAAVLLFVRNDRARAVLVTVAVSVVAVLTLVLAAHPSSRDPSGFPEIQKALNSCILVADALLYLFILYVGIRERSVWTVVLLLPQAALSGFVETHHQLSEHAMRNFHVDSFTVVLALINGLVGGGICLYALGYMREYHGKAHPEAPDRRPFFFALLFVFMGAMYGILFSNNLLWVSFFWEVTTLCCFLLIGYSRTDEARRNSMRALKRNLVGGVAFSAALFWLHGHGAPLELQALIQSAKNPVVLLPAALLCLTGITKSAQLPFSSWLLGAMVAPTPVSALLHSSTMVKAGVYLILRMSPIITGTNVGLLVALVGGVTFLIGSLAAITAADAKRVLAWSTVANLGLIVLCGGVGTYEALWAGMLLIIFHAVAKCLLFLCVGIIDGKLHSRDIERMAGLIVSMPRISVMMQIGMAGMFLAPFGMLISKWAVLKAVVDFSPVLSGFIVFGSAATLFFWVKWMGKLIEVVSPPARIEPEMDAMQAVALYGLSAATVLACLLFPVVSAFFIEPYIISLYGHAAFLGRGNVLIMITMMVFILLFPLAFLRYGRGVRVMEAYLGGANLDSSTRFAGSAHRQQDVALGNYYLTDFFNEPRLVAWGTWACALLSAAAILAALP